MVLCGCKALSQVPYVSLQGPLVLLELVLLDEIEALRCRRGGSIFKHETCTADDSTLDLGADVRAPKIALYGIDVTTALRRCLSEGARQ